MKSENPFRHGHPEPDSNPDPSYLRSIILPLSHAGTDYTKCQSKILTEIPMRYTGPVTWHDRFTENRPKILNFVR